MNWEQYQAEFSVEAARNELPPKAVEECLVYAKELFERGLPIIYDQKHLSLLVGNDIEYILKATNSNGPFYRTYEIPKRSGGTRRIDEPLPSLKFIQRWVLDEILSKVDISSHAHAFSSGCSIVKNARIHCCSRKILSLDIENFFGTICFPRVYAMFARLGYSSTISTTLSHLVTLHGVLPQGAPTSPAISNIVSLRMDRRFSGYARKHGINYTRYADDITFSGDFAPGAVIKFAKWVISEEGFKLNEKKTRLMEQHQAQEVTGIITNVKTQVPRMNRRKLRQIAYCIKKYGLDDHLRMTSEFRANYVTHILGMASHVLHVNPYDRDAIFLKSVLLKYGQ